MNTIIVKRCEDCRGTYYVTSDDLSEAKEALEKRLGLKDFTLKSEDECDEYWQFHCSVVHIFKPYYENNYRFKTIDLKIK